MRGAERPFLRVPKAKERGRRARAATALLAVATQPPNNGGRGPLQLANQERGRTREANNGARTRQRARTPARDKACDRGCQDSAAGESSLRSGQVKDGHGRGPGQGGPAFAGRAGAFARARRPLRPPAQIKEPTAQMEATQIILKSGLKCVFYPRFVV